MVKNKNSNLAKQKLSKNRAKFLLKLSEGLSVFLSMVIITLIVLFSISVTTMVTDSAREAGNVKQGTMAYYGAEGGIEQALWANKRISESPAGAAGATLTTQIIPSPTGTVSFDIQGVAIATGKQASTVNGKFIIPFPWTGDVPWHGDGSLPSIGGCSPEKPPKLEGSSPSQVFVFNFGNPDNPPDNPNALEHPCNWGKLAVGQKVAIPLYGKLSSTLRNYTNFEIRLRTPCANGNEYCLPAERMELNCWDKGLLEKKCMVYDPYNRNPKRGEVVLAWQITAEKFNQTPVTLKPYDDTEGDRYHDDDSQFSEGKINQARSGFNNLLPFVVLSSYDSPYPSTSSDPLPLGRDLITNVKQSIFSFLALPTNLKPVLSLSAVSSLVGCENPTGCNNSADNPLVGEPPQTNTAYTRHLIPYLEYQVIILDSIASSYPPVSKDNIITAESQSGPFTQVLQVKVPIDSSSLEYVIQQ
jgi:hypothetical protein